MPKVPEDEGLSIWKPFSREDFPTHTSWVQKLNASEALLLGVSGPPTLWRKTGFYLTGLSTAHLISTATDIATSVGAPTQFTALAPPGQADPLHNHTTEPSPLGQTDSLGSHTAEPPLPHLSCPPDWQKIILAASEAFVGQIAFTHSSASASGRALEAFE